MENRQTENGEQTEKPITEATLILMDCQVEQAIIKLTSGRGGL